MHNTRNPRQATDALWQLAEDGILEWKTIARACLSYMSEADVADMAHCEGFIEEPEDNEEGI